ncbi:MAG: hypothetical protein AAB473_00570 [Patescibacteria group bacterium]
MSSTEKLSSQQWLQRFKELDLLGRERPLNFSLEIATKEVLESSLIEKFEKQFGTQGYHPDGTWTFLVAQWPEIQDATYHTGLLIKGWNQTSPQDRLEIRLSNFGRLAYIHTIDDTEPDDTFFTFLGTIISCAGYTLLDDDVLHVRWNDHNGLETCAQKRFFEYL